MKILILAVLVFLSFKIYFSIFDDGDSGEVRQTKEAIFDNNYSNKQKNNSEFPDYLRIQEPIQENVQMSRFDFYDKKYDIKIKPQAKYKIYAKVASKKSYENALDGMVRPYDFLLAWGDFVDIDEGFTYTQSNRHGYTQYSGKALFDKQYFIEHIANTHMVPASKEVFSQLKEIKEGQKIYMEGYLVDVDIKNNNNRSIIKTSLVRDDEGNYGCETFYVQRIKIDG